MCLHVHIYLLTLRRTCVWCGVHDMAGGLAEAVDALLDRKKRLGIWAPRKTWHMALHK